MDKIAQKIKEKLNLKEFQVTNVIELIDAGNTIPFIARYRKEMTGNLSDDILREFDDLLKFLRNLEEEKERVIRTIEEQGKLTDELRAEIEAAETLQRVEDLYRPYRPKRKTRASVAREKGLEPLAVFLLEQTGEDPLQFAQTFINSELGVETAEDALAGAQDIIAETISDNAEFRSYIRNFTYRTGILSSSAAKEEDSVYRLYYDFSQAVRQLKGYRVLAINRGEKEDFLKVSIEVDAEKITQYLISQMITKQSPAGAYITAACEDAYKRLIAPSIERDIRNELTETASEEGIGLFGKNLKQLLLQPPLKNETILGLDPGYRTGCKVAVIDDTGKVLDTGVIYPAPPHKKIAESEQTITQMIEKHNVTVIAIGNGTASKETEMFAADLISKLGRDIKYAIVNEAGASVYSASKLGAEEFPQYDVSLRSAVSIARRLEDPLTELVKIDPKSIGVGQYQHDMNQGRLTEQLGNVVEDCVNSVGVDLNTASAPLLSYVSGINKTIAKNIVAYREENGKFKNRKQLKKVPKLGEKAFTQCAGFLRIPDGENPLDATAVHPESYDAAEKLLTVVGYKKEDIRLRKIEKLQLSGKALDEAAEQTGVGPLTLKDIIAELEKPGRDPRESLPKPELRSDILDIKDLKPGMILTGTVRNVIDFGAFVDIGAHQDGLVHISQIANRFIKHPTEALSVGDIVKVKVLDVDVQRQKISLSMKEV